MKIIDDKFILEIIKLHYEETPKISMYDSSEYRAVAKLEFKNFTKVIKLNRSNVDSKLKKEKYIYNILKTHGIPVPNIEYENTTNNKIPHYIIMSFLGDNTLLNLEKLNKSKSKKIFEQFGFYVGKIHSIEFEHQGRIIDNTINNETFLEGANRSFNTNLNKLIELKVLTRLEVERSLEIYSKFHNTNNASLCHMDISPTQVILDENDELSGIIDWEWANISEPMYDFSKAELLIGIKSDNFARFKKGYLKTNSLDNYDNVRIPYLLIHLFHLLVLFKTEDTSSNRKKYVEYKKYFDELISK